MANLNDKPKRKLVDWESVEKEFRLGQKSIRMLATQYDVAPSSISRKARKEGWVQDKSEEVREKTRAALIAQHSERNTQRNTPTREDIEAAVQTNVDILNKHRKDVRKGRKMVALLLSQLMDAAKDRAIIEGEIIEETKDNGDGKVAIQRRAAMLKAVSIPSHSMAIRNLSSSLKDLVAIERQAFNIDGDGKEDKPDSVSVTLEM